MATHQLASPRGPAGLFALHTVYLGLCPLTCPCPCLCLTLPSAPPPIRLSVSTTGLHVAASDAAHHVLLYGYMPYKTSMRWEYIGKSQVGRQAGGTHLP